MTNVLIVIGFAIVIVLLIMNLMKKDHTRELSRIEKGIEDNTRTLLEDKANKEAYEKSFAMILSETMKTREYLGVSDAKLSRIATSVNAMNNIKGNIYFEFWGENGSTRYFIGINKKTEEYTIFKNNNNYYSKF